MKLRHLHGEFVSMLFLSLNESGLNLLPYLFILTHISLRVIYNSSLN